MLSNLRRPRLTKPIIVLASLYSPP
nr:TPA_asm: m25.5 uORF [Murid betaherpesvirus 1]DBA07750.1 TPA_asm: m25.5 uORF [Murid betaherpesvirus 1]